MKFPTPRWLLEVPDDAEDWENTYFDELLELSDDTSAEAANYNRNLVLGKPIRTQSHKHITMP